MAKKEVCMTEATIQALDGLRDWTMIKWYVIPLLALVFYVYNKEIRLARSTGNWNAILPGWQFLAWIF
ncbi:MAG: hypothetical protein R2875_11705 [Desulfobacterales bacterium]